MEGVKRKMKDAGFIELSALMCYLERVKQQVCTRHHAPPPEAYTACEGKISGDSAEFVSPHGDTVTGTCEQEGDLLVLRPDQGQSPEPPEQRKSDNSEMESSTYSQFFHTIPKGTGRQAKHCCSPIFSLNFPFCQVKYRFNVLLHGFIYVQNRGPLR